ncbi:hypothetical protein ACF0H5_019796 [Mactra antiquata]
MTSKFIILSSLVGICFAVSGLEFSDTAGLRCYACYGIGYMNECEKYDNYQQAIDHDDLPYEGPVTLKTCTPPFDKVCIIESLISDIGEKVEIRDCSDNKTFDFTEFLPVNTTAYRELVALSDDNTTSCEHDVCLTKCVPQHLTDICNGPQFNAGFRHILKDNLFQVAALIVYTFFSLDL